MNDLARSLLLLTSRAPTTSATAATAATPAAAPATLISSGKVRAVFGDQVLGTPFAQTILSARSFDALSLLLLAALLPAARLACSGVYCWPKFCRLVIERSAHALRYP